jgi:hypothetical protein
MQGQSRASDSIVMAEKPTIFGASLSLLEKLLMHSRHWGLAACENE